VSKELKAAYEQLEQSIQDVARLEQAEGVLTDWVVVGAWQRFDEAGDGITNVEALLPAGRIPHYRLIGLLDFALTMYRAQVTDP